VSDTDLCAGDHYELSDSAKKQAVTAEIEEMAKHMTADELRVRYGELYEAVCTLPSKVSVDIDRVLRDYLSRYIHDLQSAVVNNPTWELAQIKTHLNTIQKATAKVFSVSKLTRGPHKEFRAVVLIAEMLSQKQRLMHVNHQTNAGMGEFTIEQA